MVGADHGQDRPGEVDPFEDGRADLGVLPNLGELFVRQLPRLEQDVVRDAQLADVFEQGARVDRLHQIGVQAHVPGGGDGGALDADDVLVRVLVFGVNGDGEAPDGAQVQVGQALDVALPLLGPAGVDGIRRVGQPGDGSRRRRGSSQDRLPQRRAASVPTAAPAK